MRGRGNRNREIAMRLLISKETDKIHPKHVMKKLGAIHRTQAVAMGLQAGRHQRRIPMIYAEPQYAT